MDMPGAAVLVNGNLECFLVSADPGGNCCSSVSQRNAPKWNRGEDDREALRSHLI